MIDFHLWSSSCGNWHIGIELIEVFLGGFSTTASKAPRRRGRWFWNTTNTVTWCRATLWTTIAIWRWRTSWASNGWAVTVLQPTSSWKVTTTPSSTSGNWSVSLIGRSVARRRWPITASFVASSPAEPKFNVKVKLHLISSDRFDWIHLIWFFFCLSKLNGFRFGFQKIKKNEISAL